MIVGSSVLQRADGASIYDLVFSLANKLKASKNVSSDWRTLNIMHRVSCMTCMFMIVFRIFMLNVNDGRLPTVYSVSQKVQV